MNSLYFQQVLKLIAPLLLSFCVILFFCCPSTQPHFNRILHLKVCVVNLLGLELMFLFLAQPWDILPEPHIS